ncbi:MAG TPA: diguanylate cyclase, partial [Ktedonobacteraceae bacterium]|nr:diguanylate cyclase [Ktedonobacteraceae bacterium]
MKATKHIGTTHVPWRMLVGLFFISLILAIFYVVRPGSFSTFNLVTNIVSILYPVGLALLCYRGSSKFFKRKTTNNSLPPTRYFVPILLSLVMWCFAAAQVAWFITPHLTHHTPHFPQTQHLIFLGMYPLLICALLFLPSRMLSPLARLRIFLDSLIIMVSVTALCCYFILAPILEGGAGTQWEKIMASIFPSADLVLMFCLLLVAFRSGEPHLRAILIMFGLAVLFLFIVHVIHLYELLDKGYDQFSPANAFLLAGGVLLTGAAQTLQKLNSESSPPTAIPSVSSEQTGLLSTLGRWKALMPSVLALIFGLFIFAIWLSNVRKPYPGLARIVYVGGFVVLLLVVLRQLLAVYEIILLQRELQNKNHSLNLLNTQLEHLATSDPLTNLPNHRTLVHSLTSELDRACLAQEICSIIFMDIDYFKEINDRRGHLAGDNVLLSFAKTVRTTLRPQDSLGRWGGEEFLAILPGLDTNEALIQAEQIRIQVTRQACSGDINSQVTCSLGVATYPCDAVDSENLFRCADKAMYAAKRLGRNQIRSAQEPLVLAMSIGIEKPDSREETIIMGIVETLAATQEARDYAISQHARRVSALALKLAQTLGLSDAESYRVSLGGLLHDLGKVATPDAILFKRGQLEQDEYESMRRHPVTGAE